MYLEKLSLHNYRGIRDMEIEFDRHLNVFVGDNGCGKTTIIDAIYYCLAGARLNHIAGAAHIFLKEYLTILHNDINGKTKHAENILKFNVEDESVRVVSSSDPDEVSSTLKDKFDRVDDLKISLYPALRSNIDIYSMLYTSNSYDGEFDRISHALKWLKEEEDKENAEFRSYVDEGNSPAAFVLNPKLYTVKKAVNDITGFSKLSFNNLKMGFEAVKTTNGENIKYDISQLSLGEKVFIGMITAIARDIVEEVSESEDLLGAEHLIIIDEIDLHLHPKWQRRIIPALRETFPNCQFIITTHSPQVIGEVPAENLFVLYRDENGDIQYRKPNRSKGLTSSEVLTELMGAADISKSVAGALKEIYTCIESEEFEKARELIDKAESELGEIPALIEARTMLELSE